MACDVGGPPAAPAAGGALACSPLEAAGSSRKRIRTRVRPFATSPLEPPPAFDGADRAIASVGMSERTPAASTRTPRAFVAGATGYTGRAVVESLIAHGAEAYAHVRPDSAALPRWRNHFADIGATIDTTPWSESAMLATLTRLRPTHIFALLGTTKKRAKRAEASGRASEDYEAVDYGLTALLLRAAVDSGIAPHFTYLSAIGANARSRNEYVRVRGRIEAELAVSGLPYLIARPSFITGADRDEPRPAERIGARVADRLLGVAGALGARKLRDRYASMTGTELADSLVRLALASPRTRTTVDGRGLRAARG